MSCSKCGKNIERNKMSVIYNNGNTSEELCVDCFNKEMEETLGIDTQELIVKQIILSDNEGKKFTFDIIKMLVPTGIAIEARDVNAEGEGYQFSVLGDINCDVNKLFKKLYKKVENGISIKYINNDGIINDRVAGRIAWDEKLEGRLPMLVIDGKEYSWNEFGRLIITYEGFQFKLDIMDMTD